jgi:hypothetical protein
MCITEHVYHSCGHWGQEQFIGEPCIRSRVISGQRIGCIYKETVGMANSREPCASCRECTPYGTFSPWVYTHPSWSNNTREHLSMGQTQAAKFKTRALSWQALQGRFFPENVLSMYVANLDLGWTRPRSARQAQDSRPHEAFSGWYHADGNKCSRWDWFSRRSPIRGLRLGWYRQ